MGGPDSLDPAEDRAESGEAVVRVAVNGKRLPAEPDAERAPCRRHVENNYMILINFSEGYPMRVRLWVLASARYFGRPWATLRGLWSPVLRGRVQRFRRAVLVWTDGGTQRPQRAEIRCLRTPKSAAGQITPRPDGTLTRPPTRAGCCRKPVGMMHGHAGSGDARCVPTTASLATDPRRRARTVPGGRHPAPGLPGVSR